MQQALLESGLQDRLVIQDYKETQDLPDQQEPLVQGLLAQQELPVLPE